MELVEERWKLLKALRDAQGNKVSTLGKSMVGYQDYYDTAHRLLSDSRWPATFTITDEDRKRYGNNPVGISAILARNAIAADGGTHYVHICHPNWDHHVQIWDKSAASNHYKQCDDFDPAFSSLLEDLSATRSKHDPSKTLLDETLVVCMGEFGRTVGALNNMDGRDHHNKCYPALFAGAGVKGGTVLGASDGQGSKCVHEHGGERTGPLHRFRQSAVRGRCCRARGLCRAAVSGWRPA